MRLKRVDILNFRSIADARIEFEPSCRILVGINESGKTNILKALSLLDAETKPKDDDIREFSPDEDPAESAHVRFIFAVEKEERISAYESFAEKVLGTNPDEPIIRLHGKDLNLAQFFNIKTETLYQVNLRNKKKYWSGWALPEDSEIIGEWKCVTPGAQNLVVTNKNGDPVSPLSFSLLNNSEHYNITPQSSLKNCTVEELNSLATKAINDLVKNDLPSCIFWSYNEANLLPGQIDLNTFASNPDSCLPLKHMFALADYNDIKETIETAQKRPNGLRNLLKRVSDVSTDHMHHVWKEYKDIRLVLLPNGDKIDANIEDSYNLYDLSRRSDGFKRLVLRYLP